MSIIYTKEIIEGRAVSGTVGNPYVYSRVFAVKVDDPAEPLRTVATSAQIYIGSPYPDDSLASCTGVDVQLTEDLLLYHVTYEYTSCNLVEEKPEEKEDGTYECPLLPDDVWSGGSSVASAPAQKDIDDNFMTNGAGQTIPGLSADMASETLSLVKGYLTCDELFAAIDEYTNSINDAAWARSEAKTWKCQGCSWTREIDTTQPPGLDGSRTEYYLATWTFQYESREWKLEPLNIGFMYVDPVQGVATPLKNILGTDGQPVTEPVPLTQDGQPMKAADATGILTPEICNNGNGFEVYRQKDFTTAFGDPCPATGP